MKVSTHASDQTLADAQAGQYLTFWLGKEIFAVGILSIKEIIQFGQLTTVPLMPPYIRGVINLRGSVVPVIDLSVRLGRNPASVGKRTCIVIVEVMCDGAAIDIGVMVDAVSAVIDIPADKIEVAPSFGASVRSDFIEGIGKVDEHFIVILHVGHTFAMDELAGMDSNAIN